MLKTFIYKLLFFGLLISFYSCELRKNSENKTMELNEEVLYRPYFHFTPQNNWTNDPNGMFFFNGYYHLYFQHHPKSNKWGPMHWGHAISTDMITWREQPIALYPDEKGYIFSGSAVVDVNNTSGFGKEGESPIVAAFTYHNAEKEKTKDINTQTQGIAYSQDEGLTWTKYDGNPVIENPGVYDFRDPKVIWDAENTQWVLTLAASQVTKFYTSKNLKDWEFASDFGEGIGFHHETKAWECPDLFPVEVEGTDEVKWVHLVSVNPGGPNGGSATQYFVGDFDGQNFIVDPEFASQMNKEHDFWVDFGKDNYAGVTWSNIPDNDGRRLFIGWMSNWQYANEVPTEKWRGSMTIARELKLTKDDTYRLKSLPVQEMQNYRTVKFKNENVRVGNTTKLIDSKNIDLTRAEVNIDINDVKDKSFSLILKNNKNEKLLFGYDSSKEAFYVDRGQSGKVEFSKDFGDKASWAPRISEEENMTLKILLDKTSIELFFDEGRTVMTEIFFPSKPFDTLIMETENQDLILGSIEVNQLKIN